MSDLLLSQEMHWNVGDKFNDIETFKLKTSDKEPINKAAVSWSLLHLHQGQGLFLYMKPQYCCSVYVYLSWLCNVQNNMYWLNSTLTFNHAYILFFPPDSSSLP